MGRYLTRWMIENSERHRLPDGRGSEEFPMLGERYRAATVREPVPFLFFSQTRMRRRFDF